jgi:hypothetical protein
MTAVIVISASSDEVINVRSEFTRVFVVHASHGLGIGVTGCWYNGLLGDCVRYILNVPIRMLYHAGIRYSL